MNTAFKTGNVLIVTPPESEPLTLDEVKAWLKVDGTDEDTLLSALITTARQSVEKYCQMAVLEQEAVETFPRFERNGIRLSLWPLMEVGAVKYRDTGKVERTLDDSFYGVDVMQRPGLIFRQENALWPLLEVAPDAVTVEYTAGYATAEDVPAPIKTAMLLMIADWYDNRTDSARTLPTAAERLLNQYRVWMF
jgi:uncharacterized phiE125 gp8 family phage protein